MNERRMLKQALLAMKRIYQAGYDRIIDAGGTCDTPDYMMSGDPTALEIRALLDAPAYPNRLCHIDYTAHPYICGCLKGDEEAQRRFDEHQAKAAQPQGVPVYMVRSHGSDCWEEISGESLELCQADPGEYEVRKLYAEQPAPVAVVSKSECPNCLGDAMFGCDACAPESVAVALPERNTASKNLDLEQCGYVDGWNACLDELKRLNPSL